MPPWRGRWSILDRLRRVSLRRVTDPRAGGPGRQPAESPGVGIQDASGPRPGSGPGSLNVIDFRFRRPVPFWGPALPSGVVAGVGGGRGGGLRGVPGAARPLFGVPFRTPLRCPGFAGASLRGGSIPGATSPSGGICWRRGLRCLTRAAADKLRPVPHGFQTVWTAAGFAPELRDVRPRGSVGGWSFSAQ